MKIKEVKSHIIQYDLKEELGYSQQYYQKRTGHLVEVVTDEGITGWGECFGPGNVAIANKVIVERVIQPMILEENPLNRDVLWHKVYNLLWIMDRKECQFRLFLGWILRCGTF